MITVHPTNQKVISLKRQYSHLVQNKVKKDHLI